MIKSSDLLVFFEKTNPSDRSRSAFSSTHLTISTYHSTASPSYLPTKSFEANDLNRYKNDDTRDDNTHTDEKSKRFKNEQSAIDKKEEYSTIVIIAFLENSNDDRIRDLSELHLFIARLCVCYHTARICRKEAYVYVYLRSRFLIAVCS
jgi:hypothetical protein